MLTAVLAVALAAAPCDRYAAPAVAGRVPAALHELSGLAASRRHAGVFWAHNDSGNALALYALRADGAVAARFALRGARARDPEDVAVGPCRAGAAASCVYLADTGDNLARRSAVQILRVVEPERLRDGTLAAEALEFTYPDGPRNVEALVAEPGSGRLFVVTKTFTSLGEVFRLDGLAPGRRGRAVRIATVAAPSPLDVLATAADAHPAGDRVLLGTYGRVFELRRPGATRLEEVFAAPPVAVPSGDGPQAEAAAYLRDGRGYLLGGEAAGAPLHRVGCAAP